jgi:hypothetical protein
MTDRETIERLASGLTVIAKETKDPRTARYAAGLLERCKTEILRGPTVGQNQGRS